MRGGVASVAICLGALALCTEALPGFFGGWRVREPVCPGESECMPLRQCADAVRALTARGARPRRCDFRGFVEYVCCEGDSDEDSDSDRRTDGDYEPPKQRPSPWRQSSTERPTTTTTERARPTPSPRPPQRTRESPSEKACQKYSEDAVDLSNVLELKIVNGEEAKDGEFPYMVAIGYASRVNSDLSWNCGGALISDRYVLTAAHCITDSLARNLTPVALRVGQLQLSEGARRRGDLGVEATLLHPSYRPPLKYFDLALVRSDRPVAFSPAVRPACLARPTPSTTPSEQRFWAAGWGAVDPSGTIFSPNLMKVQLRQVALDQCERLLGSESPSTPRGLDDSMMCATGVRKGQDTCFGDSGGPLVERGNLVDTLVAVTSFGGNPCAGARPGIYARVAPAIAWIESVVWP